MFAVICDGIPSPVSKNPRAARGGGGGGGGGARSCPRALTAERAGLPPEIPLLLDPRQLLGLNHLPQ